MFSRIRIPAVLSIMMIVAVAFTACNPNMSVKPPNKQNDCFEITVPKDLAPDVTDAALKAAIPDSVTVTANEDGSVTYLIPEEDHDKTIKELRQNIEEGLEALTNGDNPAIASIKHNKNFTEFKVICNTDEIEQFDIEKFVPEHYYVFYYYGSFYNFLNGTPADNIRVIYFDQKGKIIADKNSEGQENE